MKGVRLNIVKPGGAADAAGLLQGGIVAGYADIPTPSGQALLTAIDSASLSQCKRVVLREAFRRPHVDQLRNGAFEGEVREADLDRTRFHLRTTDGTIRCVMPALHTEQARVMLGPRFRAAGRYDTDRDYRPRLPFVECIEHLPETASLI